MTVLRDLENEDSAPVIHSHSCDLEDVWSHKYPLPLGTYPNKAIKTGKSILDLILGCLKTNPHWTQTSMATVNIFSR